MAVVVAVAVAQSTDAYLLYIARCKKLSHIYVRTPVRWRHHGLAPPGGSRIDYHTCTQDEKRRNNVARTDFHVPKCTA